MPYTTTFDERTFNEKIAAAIESRRQAIVMNLFYIGEQCLEEARSNHLYLNQTGNLCSSIGYCVLVDGKVVYEGEWESVKGVKGAGEDGKRVGIEYLHQLTSEQPEKGIVFLMVAGMPYAEYVEDMGLNVLDSAQELAEKQINEFLSKHFTVR